MKQHSYNLTYSVANRGVARGGTGGARAPSEFGTTVNPIQTRGADCAP